MVYCAKKRKIPFFWHQGSQVGKRNPSRLEMSFCAAYNLKKCLWKSCSGFPGPGSEPTCKRHCECLLNDYLPVFASFLPCFIRSQSEPQGSDWWKSHQLGVMQPWC